MYSKNLSKVLVIRVKSEDYEYLQLESTFRRCSVSDVLRAMIGGYRRAKNRSDQTAVYSSALEEMENCFRGVHL